MNSLANSGLQTANGASRVPAHTPSAGAMRAAKAIVAQADSYPPFRQRSQTQIDIDRLACAKIIDRETANAELVAALVGIIKRVESAEIKENPRFIAAHSSAFASARAALARAQA